ncbi:ureE [Acrasis kona]|uniref:UreE n=1 Tax=Acrasis kona TaxID=1008807 RepID=A0AAW2YJN0_9EUKA
MLQYIIRVYTSRRIKVGRPALTARESFESDQDTKQKAKFDAIDRQNRAMQDFFRDTGGKVNDLRVLRSAMYISDEIDRAVRGVDVEGQYVGWRPYNRFYAQGTEEMFTNIPTGRSPLVMAAPRMGVGGELQERDLSEPQPVEYQALRKSHLQQVGRAIDEIKQSQTNRLLSGYDDITNSQPEQNTIQPTPLRSYKQDNVRPLNDHYQPKLSTDLRVGAYQRYEPIGDQAPSLKQKLFKFEGEISERRPDLDYKFE